MSVLKSLPKDDSGYPLSADTIRLLAAVGDLEDYGIYGVTKHGRAVAGVQTTATDIWDRADATPTQQIWTAPTQARVHNIVSSSASDTSAGVGARTVRIYGLKTWDDATESSEDITLNGTTDVATTNSWVIIHRMEVVTWGATNINVGTITATAVTDASVTAQINVGKGRTQMAIYGISSKQILLIDRLYANAIAIAGGAEAIVELLVNDMPATELTNFKVRHTFGVRGAGSSNSQPDFDIPKKITGAAIVKINATGDAADMDLSAGFDGLLVNK